MFAQPRPYRLIKIACLILTSISGGIFNAPVTARTWYVKADGTGDAPTIQAAVDAANAGDTVLVDSGTYTDTHQVVIGGTPTLVNVHIPLDIVLTSKNGPAATRIGDGSSTVAVYFIGVSSAAQIRGFDIRSTHVGFGCIIPFKGLTAASASVRPTGVRCESSSCVITANVFHDADASVHLFDSDALVTDNHIASTAYGVRCEPGSDATIMNNVIEDCGSGIYALDSSVNIVGNTIRRTTGFACRGIETGATVAGKTVLVSQNLIENIMNEAVWCTGNTPIIEENTIRKCLGIDVNFCPSAQLRQNVLVGNDHGFFAQGATGIIVESNTCVGNAIGLSLTYGTSGTLSRNIVDGGKTGVECDFPGALQFECNDVFGADGERYSGCSDQTGLSGNFSEDPQFCGIAGTGNYYLQSDSPCASGNTPGGVCDDVGAFPVACTTVRTRPATWGAVKALYRTK